MIAAALCDYAETPVFSRRKMRCAALRIDTQIIGVMIPTRAGMTADRLRPSLRRFPINRETVISAGPPKAAGVINAPYAMTKVIMNVRDKGALNTGIIIFINVVAQEAPDRREASIRL